MASRIGFGRRNQCCGQPHMRGGTSRSQPGQWQVWVTGAAPCPCRSSAGEGWRSCGRAPRATFSTRSRSSGRALCLGRARARSCSPPDLEPLVPLNQMVLERQELLIAAEAGAELHRLQRHARADQHQALLGGETGERLALVVPGAQADRVVIAQALLAGVLIEVKVVDLTRLEPLEAGTADAADVVDEPEARVVHQ